LTDTNMAQAFTDFGRSARDAGQRLDMPELPALEE